MIFHLVEAVQWAAAIQRGEHRPPSLSEQGFIHFSSEDQVLATANQFFAGHLDLVLLMVDETKLEGLLKYEEGEPGQLFPHFYGPLPVAAVTAVVTLKPDARGVFRTLPAEEEAE